MARDGSFIYQFISDFWDLLPTEDRKLIAVYWHALIQAISDLYQETFETNLATSVQDVQVFRKELWNQYQLNSSTTTISSITDTLTLSGVTAASFSKVPILFDTLQATNTSGSIHFAELVELNGTTIVDLEYDSIFTGTLKVRENLAGGALFIEGRDYIVNLTNGTIARVFNGGIPDGETVLVSYDHPYYKEDIDYTIDRTVPSIARTATSNIPTATDVGASYDYISLSPIQYGGTAILTTFDNALQDSNRDFTGLYTGRIVTIHSGVNAGTYTIDSVLSSIKIKLTESLTADDGAAVYTIANAFPYTINVDTNIYSVPYMQDLISEPTQIFLENVDYIIGDQQIGFREVPPITREADGPTLWAEETYVDEETVYRNFGVLIDFYRESSETYLLAVQGLWYAYWFGPAVENLQRGMHILMGLPFAINAGTVTDVDNYMVKIRDVFTNGLISSDPIRYVPTGATDSITAATSTIVFSGAIGIDDEFVSGDVGTKVLITGCSDPDNNGVYTIATVVDGQTITVTPAPNSDETVGFEGRLFEGSSDPIDVYEYSDSTFTQDDVNKMIKITASSNGNDGVYEILEILAPNRVRVSPAFPAEEGYGGFLAEVWQTYVSSITIEDEDGVETTYTVSTELEVLVEEGDTVEKFQPLTEGVYIRDKVIEPGFVEDWLGRHGIQRFLTQYASKGPGDSDETKALTLLEEHLWLAQAKVEASSEAVNVADIITFLQNLKPKYTEFVFAFLADFEESLDIAEDLKASDISLMIDLTTILRNAWPSYAVIPDQYQYNGTANITSYTLRSPSTAVTIAYHSYFSATDGNFTSDDIGRSLVISSSGSGNDGTYTIYYVLSSTEVLVTPNFTANEGPGGFTVDIKAIIKLTDSGATFTSDTRLGDIIIIDTGNNTGHYKVMEVIDNTNLLIFEIPNYYGTALDGPFAEEESGVDYSIMSYTWFMDQGSIDLIEDFIHERSDGYVVNSTTFRVNSSVNLYVLGIQPGFNLVIRDDTNSNLGIYAVATIVNKTDLTISGTFTTTAVTEDYAISLAAIQLINASPPPNEAAEPI